MPSHGLKAAIVDGSVATVVGSVGSVGVFVFPSINTHVSWFPHRHLLKMNQSRSHVEIIQIRKFR